MGHHRRHSSRATQRGGYALLWVLVILGAISTILAAAAPLVMEANDLSRVVISAEMLRKVSKAVDSFNLVVKRGGTSWTTPNKLSLLTSTVVNGSQAGCTAQTYNATAVTNWAANGPFGEYFIQPAGLWTPIGRINDAPSRSPTTLGTLRTSNSDPMYIQIEDVDVKVARLLDAYVDGTPGQAADTVQYTNPAADSTVIVSYNVTLARLPAC